MGCPRNMMCFSFKASERGAWRLSAGTMADVVRRGLAKGKIAGRFSLSASKGHVCQLLVCGI
jgi:hypothetical protein